MCELVWCIIHGNEKMHMEILIVLIDCQKNNSKSGKMYCWMMEMNDNGKKINLLHHFGIIWGNEDITWAFSRA